MLRSRRGARPSPAPPRSRPPSPPRVALAGAGTAAALHGLAAAATGLRVVAVASRTATRAAERAEQLGGRPATFDELPGGAEVVVVATPPADHAARAAAALAAGATVVVETPLAATLADADTLVDTAGTSPLVYGENLAFAPVVGRALELVRDLGPLGYLEARALSPRPTWGGIGGASWGGGALLDLGCHPVALVLLAAGDDPPVEVVARLDASPGSEVDDHAEVQLSFASGLRARVEASWRHAEAVWDLQASSATGVVRLDLVPEVALERNGDPVPLPPARDGVEPHLDRLGYLARMEATAAVAAGGPSPLDARFGRRVLDAVCGAYASAASGAPVALPFAGPRDRTPVELWRG